MGLRTPRKHLVKHRTHQKVRFFRTRLLRYPYGLTVTHTCASKGKSTDFFIKILCYDTFLFCKIYGFYRKNPRIFTEKSTDFYTKIQGFLQKNPRIFTEKSKDFYRKIQGFFTEKSKDFYKKNLRIFTEKSKDFLQKKIQGFFTEKSKDFVTQIFFHR